MKMVVDSRIRIQDTKMRFSAAYIPWPVLIPAMARDPVLFYLYRSICGYPRDNVRKNSGHTNHNSSDVEYRT
jgi:hypothetical protein